MGLAVDADPIPGVVMHLRRAVALLQDSQCLARKELGKTAPIKLDFDSCRNVEPRPRRVPPQRSWRHPFSAVQALDQSSTAVASLFHLSVSATTFSFTSELFGEADSKFHPQE